MTFDIFSVVTIGAACLTIGLIAGSELNARMKPLQSEMVVSLDLGTEIRRLAEQEGLVPAMDSDVNRVLQRIAQIS